MNATLTTTTDQAVYVCRHGHWANGYSKGRVAKVTPTGQMVVVVERTGSEPETIRFNTDGREIGEQRYHGRTLHTDTDAVEKEIAYRQAQSDTNAKVAELTKVLADHRTGAGDYNISTEVKAELAALIAAM